MTRCTPPNSPYCRPKPTGPPQIVALYDVLIAIDPSPVVALNRAAAIAMRDGPEIGLALLDSLAGEPRLRDYHPFALACADLLHRLGRLPEATSAYEEALTLAGSEPERAHLRRRLAAITKETQP